MAERLLLVSSDACWLEGTTLLLERAGVDLVACRDDATAVAALIKEGDRPFSAAVVFGYHVGSRQAAALGPQGGRLGYGARDLADALRGKRRKFPIVFVAPEPVDLIQAYAKAEENVNFASAESI